MICDEISFKNFRNIENSTISLDKAVNVFYGNNAEGKTNALEGIYIFAQGKSFRSSKEKDLINFNKEFADVNLTFTDARRTQKMSIKYFREKKKICNKNDIEIKKMSEFIGHFRAVLFCPEHLSMVKDGPAIRRNFLDVAISQIKPIYVMSLLNYNNILNQRNALLKNYYENHNNFEETIELWSKQLAKEAAFITIERVKYTQKLDTYVNNFLLDMTSGREKSSLVYFNNISIENNIIYNQSFVEKKYYDLLTENLKKETKIGTTAYGVHKDDIQIFLNNHDAKIFASQGQQRSISLAMKLGEGEISKQVTGEYPVFLFDDILSELDSKRQQYILSELENRQVIITSCNIENLNSIKNANRILVENGGYLCYN